MRVPEHPDPEGCPSCGASYYAEGEQCQNCGHGEPPEDLCDFVPDATLRGAVSADRDKPTFREAAQAALDPTGYALRKCRARVEQLEAELKTTRAHRGSLSIRADTMGADLNTLTREIARRAMVIDEIEPGDQELIELADKLRIKWSLDRDYE